MCRNSHWLIRGAGLVGAIVAAVLLGSQAAATLSASERVTISLDGTWQLAHSSEPTPPAQYGAEVPVPGLADMAQPPFADVGKPADKPGFFFYRRTFTAPEQLPASAVLMIHKAKFGTAVWLNGKLLGEHWPSFTPSFWELRAGLKAGGENELVVRVGAGRESLPEGVPTGWDFEKYRYHSRHL